MMSAEKKALSWWPLLPILLLGAASPGLAAGTVCQQVADVIKSQLPTVPASDRKMLVGACRQKNLTTRHKAKLITMWLQRKVHPSAELISDRNPSYWLYNDLVSFHQGPAPKAYLTFWPELRGGGTYVRYPLAPKSPLSLGDRVVMGPGAAAPVYFVPNPKVTASFERMPQQPKPLPSPYQAASFATSLAKLSQASHRVMPVGSSRVEYFRFFDVSSSKVDQLLTQLLLSPNPTADKTLLDLRGPTGSVQTELANLLPTHFQKIQANVKKRPTYVLVDRHTQGFKQILARFLQNKGAIIMGEPQTKLPGFARFFPLATKNPSAYFLLQLPKSSKIYQDIKAPVVDVPLPAHLPYSNGLDTMLEKALAQIK